MVDRLLAAGANPNDDGWSLFCAIDADDINIVEKLLDSGAVPDGRHLTGASQNGNLPMVKMFVDAGVDINSDNDRPLSYASEKNHISVVRYLLNKGADPNMDDGAALRKAAFFGHLQIAKMLLKKGANPRADKGDALMWAWANAQNPVLRVLLKHPEMDRDTVQHTISRVQQNGFEDKNDMSLLTKALG